ncbi:flagellar biosynthesis regulator FlaF [Actibacterium sp. 188UL27-1]|uniref:flagellar biosynthesis regulator FlaF n=1 Tax=Actibacterium sp. 188UL27-1 TaxID=2786961 RepID=UPI0019560BA4|nr:flagellar biosynthesis regulator FlaF [Actibacterium sp. 188UL27-1]
MNALLKAKKAYGESATPLRTDRGTEYAAFSRVTHRLKSAMGKDASFPSLVDALHENRRLWLVLAADVADPANGLPGDLRARLFYLAEFTTQHTAVVLRREASAEILVDINMTVMRGLSLERPSP